MTSLAYAASDSATMLRRNLKHLIRYPTLTMFLAGMPVVLMLLFVYVFGGTLGNGLGGVSGGRAAYVTYLTPGMLIFAIAGAANIIAISVAKDMTEGIIARFRTMSISRASVLTGHVLSAMVQNGICLAVTLGVALLIGYRTDAGVGGWLGALGILAMAAFALTWVAVALGLAAKSVESASNTPMFLIILPFLGSGFVPTESMPGWLQAFADNQPFTPIIESVRGLLQGDPVGWKPLIATAWCVGISLACYLWSRWLYPRKSVR